MRLLVTGGRGSSGRRSRRRGTPPCPPTASDVADVADQCLGAWGITTVMIVAPSPNIPLMRAKCRALMGAAKFLQPDRCEFSELHRWRRDQEIPDPSRESLSGAPLCRRAVGAHYHFFQACRRARTIAYLREAPFLRPQCVHRFAPDLVSRLGTSPNARRNHEQATQDPQQSNLRKSSFRSGSTAIHEVPSKLCC